ncbi:hypothetical protein BGK38_07685 [Corynebacterium diphtheriae]|nr:hypothetical protein BGK38_07685 [Corynebacterium diphtheriae]OEH69613.1 hypothetical protein BHU47_05355 [Corynebacterium diphtheriae]OEH71507.1 hypothetical protein BHU48_02995 [Corynebacterium diphtheriae]
MASIRSGVGVPATMTAEPPAARGLITAWVKPSRSVSAADDSGVGLEWVGGGEVLDAWGGFEELVAVESHGGGEVDGSVGQCCAAFFHAAAEGVVGDKIRIDVSTDCVVWRYK